MESLSIGESSRSTVSFIGDREDDDIASGRSNDSNLQKTSYLTPLQQSLVFQLTTRRKRIAKAQRRIEFWERYEEKQAKEKKLGANIANDQFEKDVIDEEYLDDLIKQRKDRLAELQQSQTLKESIVES
jgi:formamidopyrimidine-DNA glycosylase